MTGQNNEKSLDYYEQRDKYGDLVYETDILHGKLSIVNVPREYRTGKAYIYACRAIRRQEYLYSNVAILEKQLLDDITEQIKEGNWDAEELREIYNDFFYDKRYFFDPNIQVLL